MMMMNEVDKWSYLHVLTWIQWNPNFLTLQGKRKLVHKIWQFKKPGVKLKCVPEEWATAFGLSYQEAGKMSVQEIVIPLNIKLSE